MLLGSPSQCHAGLRVNITQAIRFLVTSNRTCGAQSRMVGYPFGLHYIPKHTHMQSRTWPCLYFITDIGYFHLLFFFINHCTFSYIFFSFIYSFQCNVKWVPAIELNLTLAHMQVDLPLRATDGASAGSTEASSRRWRSDTRTHQNTNPVSHASLVSMRCISACHTVTMPDVSSTGERKLLSQPLSLGRCVIDSLSSNGRMFKNTMQHLDVSGI